MVLETLQQPFIPDDTELKALQSELEEYIATHTNGFTEEYCQKYERFEELQAELDAAEAEYNSAQARYKQIQDIIHTLKGDVLTEFDDNVWNTLVENVTVFHDGNMVFLFRDGTEVQG
jgi:DNA repair exonuclease SbcCD ATPase subunit